MAQTQAKLLPAIVTGLGVRSLCLEEREEIKEMDAIHNWLVDWIPAEDQVLGNLPLPLI